jgi:hypothetical protein
LGSVALISKRVQFAAIQDARFPKDSIEVALQNIVLSDPVIVNESIRCLCCRPILAGHWNGVAETSRKLLGHPYDFLWVIERLMERLRTFHRLCQALLVFNQKLCYICFDGIGLKKSKLQLSIHNSYFKYRHLPLTRQQSLRATQNRKTELRL